MEYKIIIGSKYFEFDDIDKFIMRMTEISKDSPYELSDMLNYYIDSTLEELKYNKDKKALKTIKLLKKWV